VSISTKEALMITRIFPQGSQRFVSLPVLGPLMDRYAGWLHEQQYTWRSTRYELRMSEISEVLRHRSQTTTAIYAQVSFEALRAVALPWPAAGGAR
jgi:hypothetical protein